MYSRKGVNAMNRVVSPINTMMNRLPETKTFRRLSLKEIFSSKVLSLRITKRYLCSSLRFISLPFFLFFAIRTKINREFNYSVNLIKKRIDLGNKTLEMLIFCHWASPYTSFHYFYLYF